MSQLTQVGKVDFKQFERQFEEMYSKRQAKYFTVVGVDTTTQKVIASATLFLEKKFIRNMGTCGHIEDVVVDTSYRGHKLGKKVILILEEISQLNDVYKIVLNCND